MEESLLIPLVVYISHATQLVVWRERKSCETIRGTGDSQEKSLHYFSLSKILAFIEPF